MIVTIKRIDNGFTVDCYGSRNSHQFFSELSKAKAFAKEMIDKDKVK